MNTGSIKKQLQTKYPGKFIVENEIDNVITEILCEVEPASEHPEYSKAIAVIDRSLPHFHRKLIETYTILKGELVLHINDKEIKLKEGDSYTIEPHFVHWAEGEETWVEVTSTPGWVLDDHIMTSGIL